jgi:hypothetical protein
MLAGNSPDQSIYVLTRRVCLRPTAVWKLVSRRYPTVPSAKLITTVRAPIQAAAASMVTVDRRPAAIRTRARSGPQRDDGVNVSSPSLPRFSAQGGRRSGSLRGRHACRARKSQPSINGDSGHRSFFLSIARNSSRARPKLSSRSCFFATKPTKK